MKRRKLLTAAGIFLTLIIVISFMGACSQPAAPAPGAAPTVTVTAPAKTTTVTVTAAPTAAAPMVLKFSTYAPEVHFWVKVAKDFMPKFATITGGRVKMDFFPAGTLVPERDEINYVDQGITIGCVTTASWVSQTMPIEGGNKMPWFNGTMRGFSDFADAGFSQAFEDELARVSKMPNVKVMGWTFGGVQDFAAKFPVRKPADIKGKKLRGSGVWVDYLNAWGASAVNMPVVDVYEAIQRGIVDGTTGQASNWVDYKHLEVAPYMLKIGYFFGSSSMFINKTTISKLPKDLGDQLMLGFKELQDAARLASYRKEDYEWKTLIPALAKEIYYPTPAEAKEWLDMAYQPVMSKWRAKVNNDPLVDKLEALAKKTNPTGGNPYTDY